MKNRNIFFVLVIIAIVGFLYFFLVIQKRPGPLKEAGSLNQIQFVKIAGKNLKVDLATTPQEQEQGLSGRNKLNENEGMLFVFDHVDKYSFWMKDMNFPIDIIWISSDLKVVYIKKNALPESYPESFTSMDDSKYVLEVLSQFSEKNNLKEGDKVKFMSF